MGKKVTIKNPLKLNVSANDHRIFNSNWVCHYVLKDVIQIEREVKDGKPLFEK